MFPTCIHSTAAEEQVNTSAPDGKRKLEDILQTSKKSQQRPQKKEP